MGEFHEAVSTLLGFFTEGLSSIKSQKEKKSRRRLKSEARLNHSLKKSRQDVKSVYDRDLEKFGDSFARGDAEARSSIALILSRLAAGVLSIVTRLSKGKSTASDYQTLVGLSDDTRRETIRTFDQLSSRISSSSITLAKPKPSDKRPEASRKHSHGSKNSSTSKSHTRAKSVPNLSVTPLGLATDSAWVRPKTHTKRRTSSKSMSSMTSSKKHQTPPIEAPAQRKPLPPSPPPMYSSPVQSFVRQSSPPSRRTQDVSYHRKSIMSFASDSTKLGEIPEYKWRDQQRLNGDYPVTVFYPLDQSLAPEKEKPRSRLRRLFGKG